jgi:hypothetical protein
MAPRSARASTPAKTISKACKDKPATKQRGDAAKRHSKPAPSKLDVPKRWLKDPDREWFIKSKGKGKRKSQPHHYTVRRSCRPSLSPSRLLTVPPPAQVACRSKIWSCMCPDFLYRKRRQHSESKHIAEIKKSRRAPIVSRSAHPSAARIRPSPAQPGTCVSSGTFLGHRKCACESTLDRPLYPLSHFHLLNFAGTHSAEGECFYVRVEGFLEARGLWGGSVDGLISCFYNPDFLPRKHREDLDRAGVEQVTGAPMHVHVACSALAAK